MTKTEFLADFTLTVEDSGFYNKPVSLYRKNNGTRVAEVCDDLNQYRMGSATPAHLLVGFPPVGDESWVTFDEEE